MSSKDQQYNVEQKEFTEEDALEYLQSIENLDQGIIAAQVPPPREGMHQHIAVKDNLKDYYKRRYSHRLDADGNQCVVEDKAGRHLYVMEIPIFFWELSQKHQNEKAQETLEAMKRPRSFNEMGELTQSGNSYSYSNAATVEKGSAKIKNNS